MSGLGNKHPAGAFLDAVATGDGDERATAHVASCAECTAYVARLRAEIHAFADAQESKPDDFVRDVMQRRFSGVPSRRRRRAWVATATSALALAAGAILFV